MQVGKRMTHKVRLHLFGLNIIFQYIQVHLYTFKTIYSISTEIVKKKIFLLLWSN